VQQDGIGIHQKISIPGKKNLILGCSLRQKKENEKGKNKQRYLGQYRTIPALRLKHRSGGCGTASALPKYSIIHKVLSAFLA